MSRLEIITHIASLLASMVAIFSIIFEYHDGIMYISIICVCITGVLSCLYSINKYSTLKRYKLIRYLFFEVDENKFNIAPKILLFLDLHKKKNNFEIETISVNYILKDNNGVINSDVVWSLEEISYVKTNHFYFYTGIDLGKIGKQNFYVSCNGETKSIRLLPDNKVNSKNDIFMCHWNIPDELIKKGNKVDKIELTMEQKNSFDFNNKEVIYFFPWNFAKKIDKLKFEITYPMSLGKISMQLFEVGKIKGKRFPFHHSIDTTMDENYSTDEKKKTFTYNFGLKKENINMSNLYYILLHREADIE